jgi:hypothetical protein
MATTTERRTTERRKEPIDSDRGGTKYTTTTTRETSRGTHRRTTERRREPGDTPGSNVESTSVTVEGPDAPRKRGHGVRKARAAGRHATNAVTGNASGSSKHVLTAAFLVGILFVAVRVLADFQVSKDGTAKSKVGHPAGQYGPIPILAGLIASFFILSLLASGGGAKAKFAAIFGWAMVITLGMFSLDEFNQTAATFKDFGKAKAPPGDWTDSGSTAGNLLGTTAPATSTGTSSSSGTTATGSGPSSYVEPTSLSNVGHDFSTAFGQALQQLVPGIKEGAIASAWDKIKSLF